MSAVPATATGHRPAYLVKGSDPSLVAQAAHALVEQLVAGGDPSMTVSYTHLTLPTILRV